MKFLVASRMALRVRGERRVNVGPLELPGEQGSAEQPFPGGQRPGRTFGSGPFAVLLLLWANLPSSGCGVPGPELLMASGRPAPPERDRGLLLTHLVVLVPGLDLALPLTTREQSAASLSSS